MNVSDLSNSARAIVGFIEANQMEDAIEASEDLYQQGLTQFHDESKEWEEAKKMVDADPMAVWRVTEKQKKFIPLPVVIELIEAIVQDKLQFEQDLKFSLSKTCNFFMQYVFYKSIGKEKIYEQTADKIIKACQIVLETLPAEEERTRFALSCCENTAKALLFQQGTFKKLMKKNGEEAVNVIEAAYDLNPVKIVARFGFYAAHVYKRFPEIGTFYANGISLAGATLQSADDELVTDIYNFYLEYNKKYSLDICLLETLAQIAQNSPFEEKAEDLIKSKNLFRPGINFFANQGDPHDYSDGGSIRRCAYQLLFQLIKDKRSDPRLVVSCTMVVAKRIIKEKTVELAPVLNYFYYSLSDDLQRNFNGLIPKKKYTRLQEKNEKMEKELHEKRTTVKSKFVQLMTFGKIGGAHAAGDPDYTPLTSKEKDSERLSEAVSELLYSNFQKGLKVQRMSCQILTEHLKEEEVKKEEPEKVD